MKLKNVTVVVTRYFGGIKLGAGGLIRAYSNSVTEAAKAIGVVKRVLQKELTFSIAYNRLDEINHYLEENNVFVSNREYGTDVTFTLFVEDKDIEPLETDLTDLLKGKVDLKEIGQRYNEILLKEVNYHEQ